MLKITVIILASIISAVILQDVNKDLPPEPCARQSAPAVEKQVVPAYISNQPQSLTQENDLYQPEVDEPKDHVLENVLYQPKVYEPKVNEPKIYKPKPEKYDEPQYYVNRRKHYPNPVLKQSTSDEIVEKTPHHTTDKITTKDCYTVEKQTIGIIDPLPLGRSQTKDEAKDPEPSDTRRSLKDDGFQHEYQNDYLLDNKVYSASHAGGNSDESGRNELEDPVSRSNVRVVGDRNKPLLINNPRVCYACSSQTNPTCWEPNRRTTIKYCNKNHASCITKTFGEGSSLTLIRDCAASCGDSPIPGLEPKYKSCKVCHSDLCNSAFSIKSYKLLYAVLLITALKFTF